MSLLLEMHGLSCLIIFVVVVVLSWKFVVFRTPFGWFGAMLLSHVVEIDGGVSLRLGPLLARRPLRVIFRALVSW